MNPQSYLFGELTQNVGYYTIIQGQQFWYRSTASMRLIPVCEEYQLTFYFALLPISRSIKIIALLEGGAHFSTLVRCQF